MGFPVFMAFFSDLSLNSHRPGLNRIEKLLSRLRFENKRYFQAPLLVLQVVIRGDSCQYLEGPQLVPTIPAVVLPGTCFGPSRYLFWSFQVRTFHVLTQGPY